MRVRGLGTCASLCADADAAQELLTERLGAYGAHTSGNSPLDVVLSRHAPPGRLLNKDCNA